MGFPRQGMQCIILWQACASVTFEMKNTLDGEQDWIRIEGSFKKLKASSDMLLLPDFWVAGSVFVQWRSKLRKQVHPSGVFVPWFITWWTEDFDSSRFYRRTTLRDL